MISYNALFENDDYSILDRKYFRKLRETKDIVADPSGWTDTFSNVGHHSQLLKPNLQGYNTDISNQLNEKKKYILDLISEWDLYSYTNDNITLCHSATVGSVIVLAFLKTKGVNTIIFETPNYFATLSQAEIMGFEIIRIPTFLKTDFQLNIDNTILKNKNSKAVWLTQPRTALGFNQNVENIINIIKKLSPNDFLIIDEATEQFFPSVLSSINPLKYPQVLKIRSLFKGLGINGIRIAYLSHNSVYRHDIADLQETFLGALDVFSLEHAVDMAKNISQFRTLLSIANDQVVTLRDRTKKILSGSNCEISNIENGYIGSAIIHFSKNKMTRMNKRIKFIEYCANQKIPVILGSSMGFAIHNDIDFIRLNYFNRDYNILEGLRLISRFNC
jgi:histidinol-phosphate/aromatic aminotransferase/cobyric acid decarboxylase-like protein